MATLVRSKVPYETRVNGIDTASGKKVSSAFYHRCVTAPDPYDTGIAGTDEDTIRDGVLGLWTTLYCPVMSVNYHVTSVVTRAIIARGWPGPMLAIVGMSLTGSDTRIMTSTPHGMVGPAIVQVQGVTTPVAVNGVFVGVSVISPTELSIPLVTSGVWSGDGIVQKVQGQQEFLYADKTEVIDTTAGSITGEALPLMVTVSVRRLNTGVGRNWRSRISTSPHGESQQLNGKLTAAALTAITTAASGLDNTISVGGGNVASSYALSRTLAFQDATPFSQAETWTRKVIDFVPQPNLGSFTRRKPKLTAAITG